MPNDNTAIYITELQIDYEIPEEVTINNSQFSNYIDTLKKINRLPFSKGDIYYSDDYWDFSSFSDLNIATKNLRFNFGLMNDSVFKDDVKNFVLISLLENNQKIQTIHKNFLNLKSFFLDMESTYHVYDIKDITIPIVKDYLQQIRKLNSVVKLRTTKSVLRGFFMQYSANFSQIATKGMLDLFDHDDSRAFKSYQQAHKTQNIPKQYFDALVSACVKVMNDTDAPIYIRGAACVYIILSQTGLRIGEILGLHVGALHTTTIFNGEKADYLEYFTWKRENGNNTASTALTYINDLSRKAYDVLMDIYSGRRKEFELDYLFMGGKHPSRSSFPYHSESFKKIAFQFFIYLDSNGLLESVNLPVDQYPTLHRFNTKSDRVLRSKRLPDQPVESLTFPNSQQFRFHCCSVLAEKGIPLEYIQRFMSHLTDDMVRYHILPQNTPQEDMDFSLKTLREVVSGKTKILGGDKGLSEKINQFIEKNNFNVATDLEEICKNLSEKIPIRQKTGGVCIKSSQLRECSIDAKTNEFYCAYGVCPNIVHFYYMIDITYRQCQELLESISINEARGHKRQVEKEKNMLYNITTSKLIPELQELKTVIERDGLETVYESHPEVQPIVERLDEVEKEAQLWSTKN